MSRRRSVPVAFAAGAALAAGVAVTPQFAIATTKAATTVTCTGGLIAEIRQGPDTGLSLSGRYTLRISPSGNFTGALTTKSGRVAMTGQAIRRAVNWIFTLSGGRHLYVAGTSLNPLRTCTAANQPHFWGVATGPRFGDLGVWADLRPPRLPLSLGQ
ncbi:MAG: hypothetical protein ACLP0J_29815 [Solirubrobacteraceae bacterium]|jgi:hypothetical protein